MAFTHTVRRYASFGTVAAIPGEVIDLFWFIIDNNLKGVFDLSPTLNFELIDKDDKLTVHFTQDSEPTTSIDIDTELSFDHSWPRLFHAVDNMGRETIMTPGEL